MANNRKTGGIFKRLSRLPERSEDYARSTLPTNRWSLGWDLFKTNVGKMVKLNLLMLLFMFPIFLIFILKNYMVESNAQLSPFSQNLGIGYPAYPFMVGIAESIKFTTDRSIFLIAVVLTFYISLGLSGGLYVMRNMVWTEGVFVFADFWSGIKKNYGKTLLSTLFYVVLIFLIILSIDLANIQIAVNPNRMVIFTISKVISVIFIFYFTIVYLFMLTLNITYKLKFLHLIRNGFLIALALLPYNLFFAGLSIILLIPACVYNSTLLFTIGLVVLLFIGLSVFALVWTNYSQWVFDEFINDKVAGAKKNRGIYKKNAEVETYETQKFSFTSGAVKPITDYDIEIAELPTSFTREDLRRLEESKKAMIEDSDKFAEEHKEEFTKEKEEIDAFMNKSENKSKNKGKN